MTLWVCSCATGDGDGNIEPASQAGGQGSQGDESAQDSTAATSEQGGSGSGAIPGIDASRLRLPDMESLPEDSELAAGKVRQEGGGVIARPPTE